MNIKLKENNIINYSSGRKITDYRIDDIKNNILTVKDDKGYFGFISLANKNLMPELIMIPKYSWVKNTKNDRIIVYYRSQHGIIDYTGQFIVPTTYKEIGYLGKNLYKFQDGLLNKFGVMDANGQELIKAKYSNIYIKGNLIIAKKVLGKDIYNLQGQLLESNVKLIKKLDEESFLIQDKNKYWKVVNSPSNTISDFPKKEENKYYLVDENKKINLIKSDYDMVERSDNGCYIFLKDGKYGLIDATGKVIVEGLYEIVSLGDVWWCHTEEQRFICDKQGLKTPVNYGITKIDYRGKLKIANRYNQDIGECRYGLVDSKGNLVCEPIYITCKVSDYYAEHNVALFEINDYCSVLVNKKGEKIKYFENGEHNRLEIKECDNYIVYSFDDKKGIIDYSGKEILPCVEAEYVGLVNDSYVIVNNYLFNIETMVIDYQLIEEVDYHGENSVTTTSFDSKEKRDIYELESYKMFLRSSYQTEKEQKKLNLKYNLN